MAVTDSASNASSPFSVDNVASTLDSANGLVNQFIVSPLVNMGIAGFVFDVEDETRIDLTAQITDHYAEDNKFLQDHIAIQPDRITLRGYIGELVFNQAPATSKLQNLTQKIATINAMVPILTASARQIQSSITGAQSGATNYFSAGLSSAVDIYQTFKTLNPPKSKQAAAFNFFKALFTARTLVSLETPYTFYTSMAIESISAVQGGESKDISDFTITLKKIRLAQTKIVPFDPNKYQGRTAGQASQVEDQGRSNGQTADAKKNSSFLYDQLHGLFSSTPSQ